MEEKFQGTILGLGFKSTTNKGTFFEMRASQLAINSNEQIFRGFQKIGAVVTSLDKTQKDSNLSNHYLLMLTIGKQY